MISPSTASADRVLLAPHIRDLDELSTKLGRWLAMRIPEARDLRICDLSYPAGAGMSHETILFNAKWRQDGVEQVRGLVVRIKPTGQRVYIDDAFDTQFNIMRALHRNGPVRVAEVFWLESDPAILGAPFFVMEKCIGRVTVSYPPYCREGWLVDADPRDRRILWEDSVRQLAAIQNVPLSEFDFLQLPSGGTGFEQEWDRWQRLLHSVRAARSYPFLEEVCRQLEATMPVHRPEGIAWGDARLGNMMVGSDYRILVVMDWEHPSLGGALHDLAWWLFSEFLHTTARGIAPLKGMGHRDETIALWSEVSGIATDDLDWYLAFAAFKMGCLSARMGDLFGDDRIALDPLDIARNRALADMVGVAPPPRIGS